MKKKRVYISGPMSCLERKEYTRRFGIAEGILKAHGYDTINPARVWTSRWPWLYKIVGYKMTLLYDLWLLLTKADMICKLPGHEASRGSCIEWTVGSYFYKNGFPLKIEAEIRQAINNSKP